jgi:hypothetical protein
MESCGVTTIWTNGGIASNVHKMNGLWSGRPDSNRRRPAWEVARHYNFRHLESAGVGLESTETPGKTAVYRERLLMECKWSAARATRTSGSRLTVVPNPYITPTDSSQQSVCASVPLMQLDPRQHQTTRCHRTYQTRFRVRL